MQYFAWKYLVHCYGIWLQSICIRLSNIIHSCARTFKSDYFSNHLSFIEKTVNVIIKGLG